MSMPGETPLPTHEVLRPINEWIVEASKDAGIAYVASYNSPAPKIEDKFESFIELYRCLEVIHAQNSELANKMKVRYIDYKRLYEVGCEGRIDSYFDTIMRDRDGEDAIRYLDHAERYLHFKRALPIYRHPDNPAQLLSVQEYLEYRLNSIEDESGAGVMLVDMDREVGFAQGAQDTVNNLTASGHSRVVLSGSDKRIPIDDLGIIEWLSLVSQVVTREYPPQSQGQAVPMPKHTYDLPRLAGSMLFANRTPNKGAYPNSSLYTQSNHDVFGFRNTIGVKSANMENASLRPAIIK
jgi:hypothetical protein